MCNSHKSGVVPTAAPALINIFHVYAVLNGVNWKRAVSSSAHTMDNRHISCVESTQQHRGSHVSFCILSASQKGQSLHILA